MERWMLGSEGMRSRMARRSRRGFTLIELAIVVVIVGILSVIAVVGYRRYMLHSKITEAQTMIFEWSMYRR